MVLYRAASFVRAWSNLLVNEDLVVSYTVQVDIAVSFFTFISNSEGRVHF